MADTEFDDISVDSESFQFEEGENSAEPHSDSENSSALFDSDGEPIDDQPREIEPYMFEQTYSDDEQQIDLDAAQAEQQAGPSASRLDNTDW
jgi:hypothetical protein